MAIASQWSDALRHVQEVTLTRVQLAYGTGTAWYKSGDESKLDQTCIDSAKMAIGLSFHHLGAY